MGDAPGPRHPGQMQRQVGGETEQGDCPDEILKVFRADRVGRHNAFFQGRAVDPKGVINVPVSVAEADVVSAREKDSPLDALLLKQTFQQKE